MIRRLLMFLAFLGTLLFARGLFRAARRKNAQPSGSPRDEGKMVRDRVCNTFIPRAEALVVREGDRELFFCSESCRSTYLEDRKKVS